MNNNLLRKQIDIPSFEDIKGAVCMRIFINVLIVILTSSMYPFDKFRFLIESYYRYEESLVLMLFWTYQKQTENTSNK